MDAVLIVVTVLALVVALVMSVVAWKASSEERQRGAARVAALTAAAQMQRPPDDASGVGDRVTGRPWRPADAGSTRTTHHSGVTTEDVALNAGFLGSTRPAPAGGTLQRGLAVAAALLALLMGGLVVARVGGGGQTAAGGAAAIPLELLSLRHEREGGLLSVTGLVRNPASAPSVERVSAVVLLFDAEGALVTSATAPIDFVRLASGEESPFVVKMQAPASVARYRVSFRTAAGSLTHVDRRDEETHEPPVALTRQ